MAGKASTTTATTTSTPTAIAGHTTPTHTPTTRKKWPEKVKLCLGEDAKQSPSVLPPAAATTTTLGSRSEAGAVVETGCCRWRAPVDRRLSALRPPPGSLAVPPQANQRKRTKGGEEDSGGRERQRGGREERGREKEGGRETVPEG